MDATNKRIVLEVVDATTGVRDYTYGPIIIEVGALAGGTPANPGNSDGEIIMLRETKGCDADGNPQYCLMLRSEWYDTAKTSNPTT